MQEVWKSVVGYEGIYQVSNTGKVRSDRGELKPLESDKGYLRVCLYKAKKPKSKSIHSIVMEAFVGVRPQGQHIEHRDHNRKNNFLNNIRYCTPLENVRRSISDKRNPHGESHGCRKLNWEKVAEIRATKGVSQRKMASIYGVHMATINRVIKGEIWTA